jgi:RNA polymerase sigma factor (sigma-70 family)
MMKELARTAGDLHPLVADRARLETITDNMAAQIQRIIYGRRRAPHAERLLHGGESGDDVLQEALIALLEYDAAKLRTTWEALSVGIARKKAFAALRRATRGRRPATPDLRAAAGPDGDGDTDGDEVSVVPLDAVVTELRDAAADRDPEQAYERTQQQLVLLKLARERLSERDRTVFFGIHFEGLSRAELAQRVGLTPQGVGQLYVRLVSSLYDAARGDAGFPTDAAPPAPAARPAGRARGGPPAGHARGGPGTADARGTRRRSR